MIGRIPQKHLINQNKEVQRFRGTTTQPGRFNAPNFLLKLELGLLFLCLILSQRNTRTNAQKPAGFDKKLIACANSVNYIGGDNLNLHNKLYTSTEIKTH